VKLNLDSEGAKMEISLAIVSTALTTQISERTAASSMPRRMAFHGQILGRDVQAASNS
jgi:hypothetical protein